MSSASSPLLFLALRAWARRRRVGVVALDAARNPLDLLSEVGEKAAGGGGGGGDGDEGGDQRDGPQAGDPFPR